MLNHIVLMGRLTQDPQLHYTAAGTAVTSFSIAVNRDFKSEQQTDFIDIVAWKGTAEFITKYFSKGRLIVVSGRLQIRDWISQNGDKRKSAEVVAENVYFGDSKQNSVSTNSETVSTYIVPEINELPDDEELPF